MPYDRRMRISDSKRVVFVHLPKTGGASLESVLDAIPDARGPMHRRHDTLTQILWTEPELTSYWIFGFVRNPWARMVSWWSMINEARQAAEAGNKANQRKFRDYPVWKQVRDYDFETFVMRGPEEVLRLRIPQIEVLTAGDRQADFIGRTENYAEDVNKVREQLGLPLEELPHRHRGSHGHYREYFTPATRDRVADIFRKDLDEFGYEF
jgi:hypothetical protein